MKKNEKGFTLIELLAVIVILAIIALIAVPVVMNIITRARKSSSVDSAYSVLNSAELYYANQLIDNPSMDFNGIEIEFEDGKAYIVKKAGEEVEPKTELTSKEGFELKGTKPTAGKVILDANGVASIDEEDSLIINGYACKQDGKAVITCDTPAKVED